MKSNKGQALVEFVVIMPIFIMLLISIIDLGNIYNQSLEEIINSDRYQILKKSFQDRKPSEDLCKSCTYKDRKYQ